MRLKLKNTPEQVELIKAMGSKNQLVAREAAEAFAAFLGPVVQKVLQQAATAGAIYTDAPFNQDEGASYPFCDSRAEDRYLPFGYGCFDYQEVRKTSKTRCCEQAY